MSKAYSISGSHESMKNFWNGRYRTSSGSSGAEEVFSTLDAPIAG